MIKNCPNCGKPINLPDTFRTGQYNCPYNDCAKAFFFNKELDTIHNLTKPPYETSPEKIIIVCPNPKCQQQLALPISNSRLSVTCPKCKFEFFYPLETKTKKKVPPKRRNRNRTRWYHSNWFMIVMLIFLPVVGIILIWNNPRYRLQLKIGFTIAVIFLTITTYVRNNNYLPNLPNEIWKFYEGRQDIPFLSINLPKPLSPVMNIALSFEEPAKKEEKHISEIFNKAKHSVVFITAINKNNEIIGEGSGFIVNENGFIVTNYHVLAGAYSAEIKLATGEKYTAASLIIEDKNKDICIIKINAEGLPALSLSDSAKAKVGEEIITIGNPLGFEMTVSTGIISSIREDIDGSQYIQITAPISSGSSGGPVLNKKGAVVGIVTAQVLPFFGQNINFAIPINHLVELIVENQKGERNE